VIFVDLLISISAKILLFLQLENKELRELLSISKESFEVGREDMRDSEA